MDSNSIAMARRPVGSFVHYFIVSLPYESEKLRSKYEMKSVEELAGIDPSTLPKEGRTRDQMVKVRINQSFFRSVIIAAYNNRCCVTGIGNLQLLIAGHI